MNDEIIKLRDGRLHIFKQPGCQNFFYRFFVNGKYLTRTAKTSNLSLAKSTAETAYDSYRFNNLTPDGKFSHSWDDAERGVLASLELEEGTRTSRVTTYKVKLGVLRKFFGTMTLEQINKTKAVEDYVKWRRTVYQTHVHHEVVTNKTLRRDFDVLRAILKFALREGWIEKICELPMLSVTPKAGGWFTLAEWKHLQKVAREWIERSSNDKERQQREYIYDYMMFLVHTGLRVDEAFHICYHDISPDEKDQRFCYITVRGGKLAYTMKATECIGLVGAVSAIDRRKKATPGYKPSDLLFPTNPREKLYELLVAAGLERDERGERRTAKNFRHTFIMLRLLQGVDVYKLAKNCRTSVSQIERHYGSYINARMSRDELTKFSTPPREKGTTR